MNIERMVKARIRKYKPKGGLDKVSVIILTLFGINHVYVMRHVERVALLAEAVAKHLNKDMKAAFSPAFSMTSASWYLTTICLMAAILQLKNMRR